MIFHKLPRSFALLASAALLVSLSAAGWTAPASRTFTVNKSVFKGKPKTICVIEGKWSTGETFRYEAWSDCPSLSMHPATRKELLSSTSHGSRDQKPVSVAADTEVIAIANEFSRVLLYRDDKGEMRELVVAD